METFNWRVETGTNGSGEFKMDSAQFGDGYSQDTATGLNPERQTWPVVVTGYRARIDDVLTFIRANFTGFYWRSPYDSTQSMYQCIKWSVSPNGGDHWSLSLEFKRTYRP